MAPLPNKAPEQAARTAARLGPMPTAGSANKAAEQATGRSPRLTERGAVLIMAGCFLIGLLAATWLGWSVLAGLAFVVGCVLAAWYAAPWLAVGMILTVIIACARGLPRCIRDLIRELRSG